MMQSSKKVRLLTATTAVLLFGVVEPALAQIEEIIVTARKRDESLQNVPLAVTALDQSAVETAHVTTVADLDKLLPNVDLGDNPYAGQALGATIRGVGFSDLEKSFEPAVGFSIDGVFLASNTGAAIDAFDIEQIEVLRGPQGTLYGRNTVGGVINVKRSRPTGEAGLRLKTRLTDGAGREVFAVANAPKIGDVLSTKIYAFKREDETYADNVLTGDADDQTDILSYGAAFLFEPNDRFEALISIDAFEDESQGPPTYNLTQPGEVFCDLPNFDALNAIGIPGPPDIFPFDVNIGSAEAGCASTSLDVAEASDFELYTRAVPFQTFVEGESATVNIDYEINEDLTFTSVTGYRKTEENFLAENLGGPNIFATFEPGPPGLVIPLEFPIIYQNRVQDASQFSQELRLSGVVNDKFEFVSGLFYMDSEYELMGGEFPGGNFGIQQAFGGLAANQVYDQQTTAYAVFVDGTYAITDKLLLSGGLRYSRETKDVDIDFLFSTVDGVTGTSADESESWSSPTGRLILQYEVEDDLMLYGGYSRGFRSGGFNGRAASVTALGPYDPETVDSIELGMRAEFFGNRIRFNPTIFFTDYTDKQEEASVAVPGSATGATETTVQNAADVDIDGAELEILAQLTPELVLRGAFGYTDAEFSEFLVPEDPTDPTNTNLVDTTDTRALRAGPESSRTVGLTYTQPLQGGGSQFVFNAAYDWKDETVTAAYIDPLGLNRHIVDGTEAFDFSLSYQTLGDGTKFSVTAYVNDAFDNNAGRVASVVIVPGTFVFGTGAPTKSYGLEATLEF